MTSVSARERIVASAVVFEERTYHVPAPGRHNDVHDHIRQVLGVDFVLGDEQGFMTDAGRFVDREEGGRIALACGQIAALKWPPSLFSEDLW